MGNQQSSGPTLKKEELEDLAKKTHFEQKSIETFYKQFRREAPSGTIKKDDFKEVMRQMAVMDPFLQEMIFNAIDRDKVGAINFVDFITALSVMTRGKPDEKLEFSFRMYDAGGKGYLTREDLLNVLNAFYGLVGPLLTFSGRKYESTLDLVGDFFVTLGVDEASHITLEQYKQGAVQSPDIIQGLKLFG